MTIIIHSYLSTVIFNLCTFHYELYRLLHGAGSLDHLREEHTAFAEELTYTLHTGHEGTFDDGYSRWIYGKRLGEVSPECIAGALDEGVLEAGFEC